MTVFLIGYQIVGAMTVSILAMALTLSGMPQYTPLSTFLLFIHQRGGGNRSFAHVQMILYCSLQFPLKPGDLRMGGEKEQF